MFLTFKGIKVGYTLQGKGKPLVFLHGFLENTTMWNGILPSFSDTHQCIGIDLLGHGVSENLGYVHSMEDMATAVKAVLDHLNVTEAICIGHSMGGYVALALADQYPELVSGIALVNSTSAADSLERKTNRDRAIKVVKQNPEAYTSMAIANLFAPENRERFHDDILKVKAMAAQTSLQGIIAALEGMKIRKDRSTLLAQCTQPKLIVAGQKDPVLPYLQLKAEAERLQTTFISLSGGHMSYIENKESLIATLHEFSSVVNHQNTM